MVHLQELGPIVPQKKGVGNETRVSMTATETVSQPH